jgi:hypothetical protein
MKGAGYYDRHSGAQMSSIEALQDWVDDAVAGLPLPAPAQPVTVLDLGSSEGRNAVRLMGAIVAGLRRRTGQPVQTIYSDLASNNFNQLFANLEEARRDGLCAAGVHPAAVGGSFYGPLLPPGTVHLATCFNAIQWLDQLPAVPLPDSVGYRRPHPARNGLAARHPRPRPPSRDRPSRTCSGSSSAAPGSWSRGASCCWPARVTPTRPASAMGSSTSSTTPVSTWSPQDGSNDDSTNA